MTIRAVDDNQVEERGTSDHIKVSERKVAFDYLRAFAVLLVLLHHAVHAYLLSAELNLKNPIATATPVVNVNRWPIFDLLVMYNETFLMPLLFFVSGLFVWLSIKRKGLSNFLGGRFIRLGLPFVVGVVFMIPLAYYPAQLQAGEITGVDSSYWEFWLEMIRSGFGTAGPLWFLWVLLGFNGLAAIIYRAVPNLGDHLKRRWVDILNKQGAVFGGLLGLAIAVYLPLALTVGPLEWLGFGPFHAQISRILLYLVYFLAGTVVGAQGIDRTIFRSDGLLARRWWAWLALSLATFLVFVLLVVVLTAQERTVLSELAFAFCGGATVFGLTGFSLRYVGRRVRILDSLSRDSYGIYIVHYVYVTWLQFTLLGRALAPSLKGLLVFGGTLLLSWGTAAIMRQIKAIEKVI